MAHRGEPKKRPKKDHQSEIIYTIIGLIAIGAIVLLYLSITTH